MGRKDPERSYFSFAMARGKLLEREMLNFPIQSFTLCQKNAISPKVFNRFSKTFLLQKDVEIGIWAEKILSAAILVLQWQGENFFHLAIAKKCYKKCIHKKCYITKGIQPIFKNFPSAERRGK